MKFRKKPIVIEALNWNGDNHHSINRFVGMDLNKNFRNELLIQTPEGEHRARVGDWIIKGIKGEFYPCKPDIFESTYEEVYETY